MNEKWWARAAVIFVGGAVGTGLRVALHDLIGHEVIALAAANLTGCLLLGLISGLYGDRVSLLRLFLAVGGVASFTSWSSLALQALHPAGVMVAVMETIVGVMLAGLGHLAGWRLLGGDAR